MKLYQSKKVVRAFQAHSIVADADLWHIHGLPFNGHLIGATVDADWMEAHKGIKEGDYIVTYDNGYVSHNIPDVFEKEHTRVINTGKVANIETIAVTSSGYPYKSNKIVCADRIKCWGHEDPAFGISTAFITTESRFTRDLVPVERTRLFEALNKIPPKTTPWLVIYSNGYISISPEMEFEEGYVPLTV